MKFVFFKTVKPKGFNYKPRYWDPEAEELELRKKQLDGKADNDKTAEEIKEDMKMQMESRWRRKHMPENTGKSNKWMKLFIYAIVIFFSIYFIFFTGFINNMVKFFTE